MGRESGDCGFCNFGSLDNHIFLNNVNRHLEVKINEELVCHRTSNFLYYISCSCCSRAYVGMSENNIKERPSRHSFNTRNENSYNTS